MRCPRCGAEGFISRSPCPACQFSGQADLVERLHHLEFLLAELQTWHHLPLTIYEDLRQRYRKQRFDVLIKLGLRRPILDAAVAQAARLELMQIAALVLAIPRWIERGWLSLEEAAELEADLQADGQALREELIGAPATDLPGTYERALAQRRFQFETIEELHAEGRLRGELAYRAARAELSAAIEQLEIEAGLRPAPTPVPPPSPPPPKLEKPAVPAPPPRPPRPPLTWDRVLETLLSERTLRAIIFLGATLLFAAAVSLVVWNWQAFPPWLQVTFLALFTAIFFALGWYIRVRMKLRTSGIALSAVASLLIPLDFYAFYLSGGFPRERWAEVWLLASIVCLVAYLVTIYTLQIDFFGYLVGIAVGSMVAAGMQVAGVDVRWWQAALTGLALVLALAAEGLLRKRGRWHVLAVPLWWVAIIAAAVILPLALGWSFTGRVGNRTLAQAMGWSHAPTSDQTFATALALDWWLGGLVFILATLRHRYRSFGLVAASCFPVAVWLSQRVILVRWEVRPVWHALGWALLVPLYLVAGRLLWHKDGEEVGRACGQGAVVWAVALALLAAGWALREAGVAAVVHLILAGAGILAIRLWRRAWLVPVASFFLLSATTAWLSSREATMAQLGLAWALLAILHVIVGLWLGRRVRRALDHRGAVAPRPRDVAVQQLYYDRPVYLAGWVIAALSQLPPLLTLDQPNLAYTLGNWMVLSGWLAMLTYGEGAPGLRALLATRHRWLPPLFQWTAALLILPWIYLMWVVRRPAEGLLGVVYVLVAGLLLSLGARVRRYRWALGRPWFAAAHLSAVAALVIAVGYYEQKCMAAVLLLFSAFSFVSARVLHRRRLLVVGGLVFPVGLVVGLDWLGLQDDPIIFLVALVPTVYVVGAVLLERWGMARHTFIGPLYGVAQFVGVVASGTELFRGLSELAWGSNARDETLLWTAGGFVVLAIGFALYAWLFRREGQGHVAAWLVVSAGGFVASAYSQGRGSSAVKVALLAVLFVLAERVLHAACLARKGLPFQWREGVRRAWRLYRRPLLIAGWIVSAGAIGLALVRNLVLLGGGQVRETWAVVGLLTVTALYGFSAWLFRRVRFVWLAAGLLFAPWTLLTRLGWYVWPRPSIWRDSGFAYPRAWAVLALLELLVGLVLAARLRRARWGWPVQVIAHLILPWALVWSSLHVDTACLTFGLAVGFYLLATWADRWQWGKDFPRRARFLYLAVLLLPIWAVYLLRYLYSDAPQTAFGLLLLGFTLPALFLARWVGRRDRAYVWPLYLLAYGTAVVGTMLVAYDRPTLIWALLFDTLVGAISTWVFRRPGWVYVGATTLPAALYLALIEWGVRIPQRGWAWIALGGIYLLIARVLWVTPRGWWTPDEADSRGEGFTARRALDVDKRTGLHQGQPYARPVLLSALTLILAGLIPSSFERPGVLMGYALAAALYALAAIWWSRPLLVTPATVLAVVSFGAAIGELGVARPYYGLALWPGIAVALILAHGVDWQWGPAAGEAVPVSTATPIEKLGAAIQRAAHWWALPLYAAGYLGAALSPMLSLDDAGRLALTLLGATLVYALATYRFQSRGWLLLAVGSAQLAALAAIHWLGWAEPMGSAVLAFAPVTWMTALAGLIVERRRGEGAPLGGNPEDQPRGWSRPLYLLLLLDLWAGQTAFFDLSAASAWASLSHALLVAMLATAWASSWLPYVAVVLGIGALGQGLLWLDTDALVWPWALALLALAYGLSGYVVRFLRRQGSVLPLGALVWDLPLRLSGWLLAGASLALALMRGVRVISLTIRVAFGFPLVIPSDVPRVQMVVSVLALLGLLCLAAAVTDRQRWLGYIAVAMLLGAWSLEWLLIWGMREVQWYAVPAGLYLLVIGYLEWTRGSRSWARWIDRAALVLLLGSSFWQSLGENGWSYALLMGAEGFFVIWWGSARRLRRFLYMGVGGVVLDIAGQLIDPLLSPNRWIVFAVAGVIVIGVGIWIERRWQRVVALSQEMRQRLETWE